MSDPLPKNALLARWKLTLARRGPGPAIFSPDGTPLRTFSEIEEESRALSGALAGGAPGSVAAFQIGNGPGWPALLLALFRAGLIPLPLGGHLEKEERSEALRACHAALLVTESAGQWRVEALPGATPVRWQGARPDFLKLTSGTTSAPRAVRFRAPQLLADADQICRTMGIGPDDLNFGVIPFSHSYGFSNLITPLLVGGVRLVASEDRMPRAILQGLAASGATVFPGTPVLFQNLAELENLPPLPDLRLCISAGAPLSRAVAARFLEKFSRPLHTFYGASECGGIAYDAVGEAPEGGEGFAGTPLQGVQIEHGPQGAGPAAVRVLGPAVGDGYFPEADAATLGGGGFTPGDLIRREAGALWIEGRVSDVINIAGRKLNPLELEARLLRCPGVRQAVVFGVPSASRGEEAVACVAAEAGGDAAEILRFCRSNLSSWQIPRDVWLVSEIPTNERGKISRRALVAQYLERSAAGTPPP